MGIVILLLFVIIDLTKEIDSKSEVLYMFFVAYGIVFGLLAAEVYPVIRKNLKSRTNN